ncbi:hypothetical protein THAOC_19270, partial [Thalassiosira oceanica]
MEILLCWGFAAHTDRRSVACGTFLSSPAPQDVYPPRRRDTRAVDLAFDHYRICIISQLLWASTFINTNMARLLGSLALAFVAAGVASAQDHPSLTGKNFKITVIKNLDYFVAVSKEGDGAPAANEFSGYIIDMIDAVSQKAGFTYEILLPSGKGESCSPALGTEGTEEYAAVYRPQFNCGQEDVFSGDSRFTIPFRPPVVASLTMYGTATGVSDFEDFLAQQQAGTQGALCIGAYTAYGNYLKSAFPDLKYYEIENTSAGALQGLTDGHCEVVINAYIYALDFIAEQHEAG